MYGVRVISRRLLCTFASGSFGRMGKNFLNKEQAINFHVSGLCLNANTLYTSQGRSFFFLAKRSVSKDAMDFHHNCNETLESLLEKLEGLEDYCEKLPTDFDVILSDGVLTVTFGAKIGTYVINKQTPNHQIWLSSPVSGPKRYDWVPGRGWLYKHEDCTLHELLTREISAIVGNEVKFDSCFGSGT